MSLDTRHPARSYEFHALVNELLQRLVPPMAPGEPGMPDQERIRFRTNPSLGFPLAEVESLETTTDRAGETRATVTVNFLGLMGTSSPLPPHYAQELLWELHEPEGRRVRDFLDLFNHRMVSFLFKAREKYRYPLRFDADGNDEITPRLLALAGFESPAVRAASGLPQHVLMRAIGGLAQSHRSAAGLESVLRACFPGIDVEVIPCVPHRREIPRDQQLFLNPPRQTQPGRHATLSGLGRDTCVGTSRIDTSSSFRVVLGPMGYDDFRGFLPGETHFAHLAKLTRLYVRDPLDFDLELRLRAPERPAACLDPQSGQRLGQTTWISPTDARVGAVRLRVPPPDTSTTLIRTHAARAAS